MTQPDTGQTRNPDFNSMNIDQLISHRKQVQGHLTNLDKMIPERCGLSGHQWDYPSGITVNDEVQVQVNGDTFGSYTTETEYRTFIIRTCKRCGFQESKAPQSVLLNPFNRVPM